MGPTRRRSSGVRTLAQSGVAPPDDYHLPPVAPPVRHMPSSMACPICGEDVAVHDGLGWAILELREAVKLRPHELVPHLSYIHMDCAKKARLLRDELP